MIGRFLNKDLNKDPKIKPDTIQKAIEKYQVLIKPVFEPVNIPPLSYLKIEETSTPTIAPQCAIVVTTRILNQESPKLLLHPVNHSRLFQNNRATIERKSGPSSPSPRAVKEGKGY
ncbi:MAG: hypothetical protein A3F11_01685 [Gammaproteobacteria bacterium RIFCSPHIGHO2_12_FULL_37_14]|nr:MAG: hypothetical protein A3F11_01685 [Gammaproteobacteria bacterium RIFCSPHIGHO2_12_FULL_37_14]